MDTNKREYWRWVKHAISRGQLRAKTLNRWTQMHTDDVTEAPD
jgi:hypothetical protein